MSHATIGNLENRDNSDKGNNEGHSEANLKAYSIGFVLSVLLTAIPFGLVLYGNMSVVYTITGLVLAAAAQVMVHLYYFLHLNASSAARWNVLALLLAILIMALIIGGTIWIMSHIHYRLM